MHNLSNSSVAMGATDLGRQPYWVACLCVSVNTIQYPSVVMGAPAEVQSELNRFLMIPEIGFYTQ